MQRNSTDKYATPDETAAAIRPQILVRFSAHLDAESGFRLFAIQCFLGEKAKILGLPGNLFNFL